MAAQRYLRQEASAFAGSMGEAPALMTLREAEARECFHDLAHDCDHVVRLMLFAGTPNAMLHSDLN